MTAHVRRVARRQADPGKPKPGEAKATTTMTEMMKPHPPVRSALIHPRRGGLARSVEQQSLHSGLE